MKGVLFLFVLGLAVVWISFWFGKASIAFLVGGLVCFCCIVHFGGLGHLGGLGLFRVPNQTEGAVGQRIRSRLLGAEHNQGNNLKEPLPGQNRLFGERNKLLLPKLLSESCFSLANSFFSSR